MIEGVKTKALRVIPDERGRLTEMLRNDDDIFIKFGQCYMTTTYPGVVKAWHFHKLQTDNFVVVTGMFKVALFDDREESPTHGEVNPFFLSDYNPTLLKNATGVHHAWQCISERADLPSHVTPEDQQREDKRPLGAMM